MDEAYSKAQEILRAHRDKLDIVAKLLIEKEKINEEEFKNIFENDK
jgi:cell division protease FtsH